MESAFTPVEEQWNTKYENLRRNREGIERRLGRKNLSSDRRKCLEWQLLNIKRAIERHGKQCPSP